MPKTEPFDKNRDRYENWFEVNEYAYQSELKAAGELLPEIGEGMEIGVGSGLFAGPLGIRYGVEPSVKMRELALERGVEAVYGTGESLPYDDGRFDYALMVTTICFLDDVEASFKEAYRVLKPKGALIIGYVDKQSELGKYYLAHKNESLFYKPATFYSTDEVLYFLRKMGFGGFDFRQTIFHPLHEIKAVEPVKRGYGEGSFVVVRGNKLGQRISKGNNARVNMAYSDNLVNFR